MQCHIAWNSLRFQNCTHIKGIICLVYFMHKWIVDAFLLLHSLGRRFLRCFTSVCRILNSSLDLLLKLNDLELLYESCLFSPFVPLSHYCSLHMIDAFFRLFLSAILWICDATLQVVDSDFKNVPLHFSFCWDDLWGFLIFFFSIHNRDYKYQLLHYLSASITLSAGTADACWLEIDREGGDCAQFCNLCKFSSHTWDLANSFAINVKISSIITFTDILSHLIFFCVQILGLFPSWSHGYKLNY